DAVDEEVSRPSDARGAGAGPAGGQVPGTHVPTLIGRRLQGRQLGGILALAVLNPLARHRGPVQLLYPGETHLRTAESGDIVPDALKRLEIVFARAGGVTDDAWVQPIVTGQGEAESGELGTAVMGMLAKERRAQD